MDSGQENRKSENNENRQPFVSDLLHFAKCYCRTCEAFFETEYYRYPQEIPNSVLERLALDCKTLFIVQEVF